LTLRLVSVYVVAVGESVGDGTVEAVSAAAVVVAAAVSIPVVVLAVVGGVSVVAAAMHCCQSSIPSSLELCIYHLMIISQ